MLYNMEQHSLQFSEWDDFISLHYILHVIIPAFFEEKKGIMCYRSLSVCPSIWKQFTSISSYTIDARITKPTCMIPLCIHMVATYLKFFYIFQF